MTVMTSVKVLPYPFAFCGVIVTVLAAPPTDAVVGVPVTAPVDATNDKPAGRAAADLMM